MRISDWSSDVCSSDRTNTLVGIVTFALGYMAAKGQVSEALAVAAVTTLLLTLRAQAHAILKGMTAQEVDSIARFALVALVILPLLPDRNLDRKSTRLNSSH